MSKEPYHYGEPKGEVQQSALQTLIIGDTGDHTFSFDLRDFVVGAHDDKLPINGNVVINIIPTLTAGVDVSSITANVFPSTPKPGALDTLITAEDSILVLWNAEAFTDAQLKQFPLTAAFGPNYGFDVVLSYDVGSGSKKVQLEIWVGVQ